MKISRYKYILLPVIFLMLAGCGRYLTRVAYNQAGYLIVYRLDDYFDINSSQREQLKPGLRRHLSWHRKTHLLRYIRLIDEIRKQKRITRPFLEKTYLEINRFREGILTRLFPDYASFLLTVNREQIVHLREKFLNEEGKLLKRHQKKRAEQDREQAEKIIERTERWTGSLEDWQKKRLQVMAGRFSDLLPAWYELKKKRDRQFIILIAVTKDIKELEKKLRDHFITKQPAQSKRWVDAICSVILLVDGIATEKQRRRFRQELDKLRSDLLYLYRM